jgi:glycosyltransferase involved in cell wall biosynthesis
MKVGIHLGGSRGGHEVRGIGVHTSELVKAINKVKDSSIQVSEFDPKEKYDLIHYTFFKPFSFSVAFKKEAKKVVLTIHDLIPLIYPKHYPGGVRGNIIFFIQKLLIKKNIDAVITISETSKKDICRFLNVDPLKIHVIYLAPKAVFKKVTDNELLNSIKEKYNLPDKFALYVGDVNYNKNIPNLIKACEIAKIKLVMVGKQAKEIEKGDLNHPELIHLKNVDFSKVMRLGFVPDEELAAIYNLATVSVQPSLYEGFGLPILEALSCGCQVVASKIQTHIEIADGLVTFVDPVNTEDIARGILSHRKADILSNKYSWEKTAKETLEAYKHV